jgi:hypothetical protein
MLKQYKNNPNGFAFSRISRIRYGITFKERLKNAVHLVSSAIFARRIKLLFSSNNFFLIFIALPLGIILNFYIRYRIKN